MQRQANPTYGNMIAEITHYLNRLEINEAYKIKYALNRFQDHWQHEIGHKTLVDNLTGSLESRKKFYRKIRKAYTEFFAIQEVWTDITSYRPPPQPREAPTPAWLFQPGPPLPGSRYYNGPRFPSLPGPTGFPTRFH
jgi:hypothetical protein